MSNFIDWINQELNLRGWSYNELARKASLSSGGISVVMTERQNPGLQFCLGISQAFGILPEDVLRKAGLLPTSKDERDPTISELLFLFNQLSVDEQKMFLVMIRAVVAMEAKK